MPTLQGISAWQITAPKGRETPRRRAIWHGGGIVNHPDQPTPTQTLAVRLALSRFHQRYPCPCVDRHDWNADCERVAWLAVLEADARETPEMSTAPVDPSVQETTEALSVDEMGNECSLVLSEWERARVDDLARYAENALKRYWRDERRYYNRCMALVEQDEEGEWVEREVADERALEALRLVEVRVDWELLLERLRRLVDEIEWAIVQGVLEGKKQVEIAQALGISPSAVCQRLAKIRRKLGEIGGEIVDESGVEP